MMCSGRCCLEFDLLYQLYVRKRMFSTDLFKLNLSKNRSLYCMPAIWGAVIWNCNCLSVCLLLGHLFLSNHGVLSNNFLFI